MSFLYVILQSGLLISSCIDEFKHFNKLKGMDGCTDGTTGL